MVMCLRRFVATDFNPIAIDLDWSTEYRERTSASSWWIGNTWTIAWRSNYDALTWIMFDMRPVTWTANIIAIEWSWWPVTIHRVSIFSSWGTTIKDWWSFGTPSTGTRMCITVTRDGTNLKIYLDWTEDTTGTKSTDSTGSMTSTNRKLAVWTNLAHTQFLDWKYSCLWIWSSVLTSSEVAVIWWSGGYNFDWRNDNGAYTSSANLVHYYVPWLDSSNSWTDYVWSNTLTAVNISSADEVAF